MAASPGWELDCAESTSDFSTDSTDVVDVPGLSVTVTTNGPIIVEFRAALGKCSASMLGGFYLYQDGVGKGLIAGCGVEWAPIVGRRRLAPPNGAHTYKIRARCISAGQLDFKADDGVGTDLAPALLQVIRV